MRRILLSSGLCLLSACSAADSPPEVARSSSALVAQWIVITSDWGAGYCATVSVTNTGSSSESDWTVKVNMDGSIVQNVWNAQYAKDFCGNITFTPLPWNRDLTPGQTRTDIGWCASRPPNTSGRPQITTGDVCPDPGTGGPEPLSKSVVVTSQWASGYCANVNLVNSGSTPISDWTVKLDMDGTILQNAWNARYTRDAYGYVIVAPYEWNRTLAPGQRTRDIGFCASTLPKTSSTPEVAPDSPATLATLTWPHCTPFRHDSPVSPSTDGQTLDAWLYAHPTIANAMQWMLPVLTPRDTTSPQAVPWTAWPPKLKALLRDNFVAYWSWYANDRTGADPTPLTDPPINRIHEDAPVTAYAYTALSEDDAQALYVKYVALSLVVELQNRTPWSLLGYDSTSLAELLDSRKFLNSYSADGYELVHGSVVPAPPLQSARFVEDNHLLCGTRVASIAEAVVWARNLQHFYNTSEPWQDAQDFWQYKGNPPASRMMVGTAFTGARPSVPRDVQKWTWGCHGTTGFLKSILRTINIPVEHFSNQNHAIDQGPVFSWTGHATPHFVSEGLWLSHGDDPYMVDPTILPFAPKDLLITDWMFNTWFPAGQYTEESANNVGRQTRELRIRRRTWLMLFRRWSDVHDTPSPPDAGLSSEFDRKPPNIFYSWDQVEPTGIKLRLDELLAPYTSALDLDADVIKMPKYYGTR